MTDQTRVHAGVPTGGQFAAHARTEGSVALALQRPQPGDYETVERHNWLGSSYKAEVNTATGLTDDEFSTIVDEAIVAALWSTIDPDDEMGEMLDASYGPHDLAPETRARLEGDVFRFVSEHRPLVEEAVKRPGYDGSDGTGPLGMLGHDIMLTRNSHGAGFWDREPLRAGGLGQKLTDAAHALGGYELYPGDDRRIHV